MDAYTHSLNDLKTRFGDQLLLSPEDIAPIIKKSVEVQANMRHFKTFPLPVRNIGRNVFVSIYHLAEWIATGQYEGAESTSTEGNPTPPPPERKTRTKVGKGKYDHCLGFYEDWRNSLNFQLQLLDEIERLDLQESIPDFPNNNKRALPAR